MEWKLADLSMKKNPETLHLDEADIKQAIKQWIENNHSDGKYSIYLKFHECNGKLDAESFEAIAVRD